jgi:two-component system response regulator FixJ
MSANTTIFVVDDDAAVKDSLRLLLESADHMVETYGSGREFLADHQGRDDGCLVLDLDLPAMSGLEVLEALTASNSDMPVILITGRADRVTRERSLGTGAIALLEKPIRDDLLLETIARALRQRARACVPGL